MYFFSRSFVLANALYSGMFCALLLLLGCRSKADPPKPRVVPSASSSNAAPRAPEPLLFLPTSAFRARIFMDETAIYVLTSGAAHRIVVGKGTETFPLDLGHAAAMTTHGFLYWSNGALWEVAKHGGEPRRAGEVPQSPKSLVASGDHFAWLQGAPDGTSRLFTIHEGEPRQLYVSKESIEALTLLGNTIYFVQRSTSKSWKIGAQRLSGGAPWFSKPNSGRAPAFLTAFGDRVFYQLSPGRKVVAIDTSLRRETILAENLVCSPMAVRERIVCAQLGGIVELSADAHAPEPLVKNERQVITDIALGSDTVVWLSLIHI